MRTPVNDEPSIRRSQAVLKQFWRRGGEVSSKLESVEPSVEMPLQPGERTSSDRTHWSVSSQDPATTPLSNTLTIGVALFESRHREVPGVALSHARGGSYEITSPAVIGIALLVSHGWKCR
jgi:hypothetical protein